MAETKDSAEQIQGNTPLSRRTKILLGAALFFVVAGISGLFFYGITHLTAPAPLSNSALQERLEAARLDPKMLENRSDNFTEDTADAGLADNTLPSGAMEDLDGDGIIDFTGPDYRYYAFETAFVSNLDNSKKLITLELSLLIKRPAFFVDSALEDLMKLSPAMRSRILKYLVTLSPDVLKTRADREALAENIRHLLNDYLKADENNEEEGILAVQILKLVVA